MVWLKLEVTSGPSAIIGKISLLRLMGHLEGDPDLLQSEWWAQRAIGRMDIFEMFGHFDGLDKISKKHILICETNYFPTPDGFSVSDLGSTNGTKIREVHKGMRFSVELAGVITLNISYQNSAKRIQWPGYIIPASKLDNEEMWYSGGQLRSFGSYEQFSGCLGRGTGEVMVTDDHNGKGCVECVAIFDDDDIPRLKTGEWLYFIGDNGLHWVGNYAVLNYRDLPTVKHGLWTLYGHHGKRLVEVVFDKGEQKEITMFDSDGDRILHTEYGPKGF